MAETMKLGKLTNVDVRELWKHEQYDFSSWLAQNDNIEYLNNILGLTLVEIETEVFVGSYRCDLVARDETSGIKVIVENQLEASNHDHLGKIITYASGLDASVIIWIVKEAREEHRSAIEWLNNNTGSNISFFLVELHAYRIGDSLPAPMFEVVEQPNDFIKMNKTISAEKENSYTEGNRYEFWSLLNEAVQRKGKPFNTRKPSTDNWYDIALGTSDALLRITLVNKEKIVRLAVYTSDNQKKLFDKLLLNKADIEKELLMCLDWDRLDNKKASRIKYDIKGLDFDDHSNYPELMDEIIDKVVSLRSVFKRYI